ncbi:hypothetical protein [Methylosinus sp. KRF6]|uniref:hypothetical protein n=1 Tax=Methylosinus sp. KRF6 TaxID=2846853 RepID=UPI001C0DC92B|nr:hypothetical protein [Methylosinus sp. KRF6]MBU3887583.1 hypothetical protein [Methylosinus sp. KRF6]
MVESSSIGEFQNMLSTHISRIRSRDWYGYFVKAYPEVAKHITQMNAALKSTYGDLVSFSVMHLDDVKPGETSARLHLMFATPNGIEDAGSWDISEEQLSWHSVGTVQGLALPYPREEKTHQARERRERFLVGLNRLVMHHVGEAGLVPLAKR